MAGKFEYACFISYSHAKQDLVRGFIGQFKAALEASLDPLVDQTPAAGTQVPEGSSVALKIATQTSTVPSIGGLLRLPRSSSLEPKPISST